MRRKLALLATAALVGAAAPVPARPQAPGPSERLAARARRGDRLARAALVERHMGLVRSIALRYRDLGVPLDDLVQEGAIGLLAAVDAYEPDRGAAFATYAFWRIRAAVTHALATQGSLVPDPRRAWAPTRVVSPDDLVDDPAARPETLAAAAEQRRALARALGALRPRQLTIVTRHFGIGGDAEPLTTIAADLRLSPERTRALKDEALRTLAAELDPG